MDGGASIDRAGPVDRWSKVTPSQPPLCETHTFPPHTHSTATSSPRSRGAGRPSWRRTPTPRSSRWASGTPRSPSPPTSSRAWSAARRSSVGGCVGVGGSVGGLGKQRFGGCVRGWVGRGVGEAALLQAAWVSVCTWCLCCGPRRRRLFTHTQKSIKNKQNRDEGRV